MRLESNGFKHVFNGITWVGVTINIALSKLN